MLGRITLIAKGPATRCRALSGKMGGEYLVLSGYNAPETAFENGQPMIQHIVFLSLPKTADMNELAEVMAGLNDLVGLVDGFSAFTHGLNIDVEGKSPEAPYGFVCQFENLASLHRYADDPRHQALGARLVALCGGAEGIKVYDISTGETP